MKHNQGKEIKSIVPVEFAAMFEDIPRMVLTSTPTKGSRVQPRIGLDESVVEAILTQDRVQGAPHDFYKYPARFSPNFPREIIRHFSNQGETVLDPFCGSGTSLVEALSLGRRAVGFDISELAAFLSRVKTTALTDRDNQQILVWLGGITHLTKPRRTAKPSIGKEQAYYQKNVPASALVFFDTIMEQIDDLPHDRQRDFVRLVLLTVGQWAFESKVQEPQWSELKHHFIKLTHEFLPRHDRYTKGVAKEHGYARCEMTSQRRIINRSCEESGAGGIPPKWLPAKLVVTSPPYPGVHVLYHRWQIEGRRETPLPFWLSGTRDGAGESYYCLGSRSNPELNTYFNRLENAFSSVRQLLAADALVFQLVAFASVEWQLPRYLETMRRAGFTELLPECNPMQLGPDGRIWRNVPGRRWYATKESSANQEVLLIHKLR